MLAGASLKVSPDNGCHCGSVTSLEHCFGEQSDHDMIGCKGFSAFTQPECVRESHLYRGCKVSP